MNMWFSSTTERTSFMVSGQVVADILAVAQKILPVREDLLLRPLRQHDVQDLHCLFAPGGVLLQVAVQRHLEVGGVVISHFSPFWLKNGKKGRVDALLPEHLYAGGAAKVHGKLPFAEHSGHGVVIQL